MRRVCLPFLSKHRGNALYPIALLCVVSFLGIPLLYKENSKHSSTKEGHVPKTFPAIWNKRFIKNADVRSTEPTKDVQKTDDSPRTLSLPIPGQAWPPKEVKNSNVEAKYQYVILFWKHGPRMVRRFLRSYGNEVRDPYASCAVRNCVVTIDDVNALNISDAILVHLHRTSSPESLPNHRLAHQRWIFFTDESPHHTFYVTNKYTVKDYDGLFNWSMTYRSDSDIPVPYGRIVPEAELPYQAIQGPLPNFAQRKKRLVAILGSNCGGRNRRWDYVRELSKHIKVDVYGGCGQHTCPGHFTKDCSVLNQYRFYLAFENSNCKEYITEKLWWNAYAKDVVPVVMGPPREDYERLCPPRSFIHVSDFASPKELATFLTQLSLNDAAYNAYFEWKRKYSVSNEHGYFGSPSMHLCRMCEALNRNTPPKTYVKLEDFWDAKRDCRDPYWTPK